MRARKIGNLHLERKLESPVQSDSDDSFFGGRSMLFVAILPYVL